MKKEKGITLIALVVTIIVLLILAGVSLSLVAGSDGILSKAGKAVDKNKISTAKEIAELVIMDVQADYYEEAYAEESYMGSKTDYILGKLQSGIESSDYLVQAESDGKIKVYKGEGSTLETVTSGILDENGKLIWDEEASGGIVANPTAGRNESSKNRTLANATTGYSYKNPVIPQGFKAVDINGVRWSYTDTDTVRDWNEGLVIEDVYNSNQFVWVPCTMVATTETVAYAKNFGLDSGDTKTDEDTKDDLSVFGVNIEENQIKKYQGFYVARFEAGNEDAINSSAIEDASSVNNIGTKAPVSKEGEKAWNYIDHNNAIVASNLMVNDSSKYGENRSGLITGKQWDTILAWYKKEGIGVEKTTQDWGSYFSFAYSGSRSGNYFERTSSTVEAWTSGSFNHAENTVPYLFHGTGLNPNAIKKNIADIGGNMMEWSAEVCASNSVYRGGASVQRVTDGPASVRFDEPRTWTYYATSFRATLYVND